MIKEKVIKIPIFFGELKLILCDDLQIVSDKYNFNMDMKGFGAITFLYEVNGYDQFCIAFKETTNKIICHESVHLVNRLMQSRGIELSYLNDETQAYLCGWVFEQCENFIKKHTT